MFEAFRDVVSNVKGTVLDREASLGRPVIGVMPAYFPMELIWAAGGYPVQLWGNRLPLVRVDAYLQSYCCTVGRSILELELSGGADMVQAYAFTSFCDTLVNLREVYGLLFDKPTFELTIPITRTVEAKRQLLGSVISEVLEGLERATGRKATPESLAEAAELFGRTRALQRRLYELRRARPGLVPSSDFYTALKAGFFLPPAEYNERLGGLLKAMEEREAPAGRRPRLVLSGMVFDPMEILGIMDELGLDVVDDDFANGWRTASKEPIGVGDLVSGVTDFLFNPAPCSCLYNPDNDRHDYLVDKARQADADGVLLWYVKFCEPDAFDRPQLIERLNREGLAATFIEVELSMTNFDSIRTRLDAFREMLGG
ncbi:MAG: 2-hydroxyacyl-CoA dehydratase family protein [Proteobacteria bacterium]|nr:2-hydroxyacyl-CoA dehydratase family protein [Pseudomonadota bacterium]